MTYRSEVAAVTCETCPLRALPEAFWEQNKRDEDADPYHLAVQVDDTIENVKHGESFGGPVLTDQIFVIHEDVVKLHNGETGDFFMELNETDEAIQTGMGKPVLQQATQILPPAYEYTPVEELGAGAAAFTSCFRAIQRKTCASMTSSKSPESAFPNLGPAGGAEVLRAIAALGSDEEVMTMTDQLREAYLDEFGRMGALHENREALTKAGFLVEAADRMPESDREFLLDWAHWFQGLSKEDG